MADAGRGNARWAQGPDEAAGVFLDEFDGLATIVAQNISVEIRPATSVELVAILNDFPATVVEGGVQVSLGGRVPGRLRRLVSRCAYRACPRWVPRRSASWCCATSRSVTLLRSTR